MSRRIVYLHGFASGPASSKAQFFRSRLAETESLQLEIPDLAEGNFENLTITGQIAVCDRIVASGPVSLIGSSLGGYLAALYAAANPGKVDRLVLLAPAFCFARRWAETLGPARLGEWRRTDKLEVYHYGDRRLRNLSYRLMLDAERYPDYPDFKQPALIFHGLRDDVVPANLSENFAAEHPGVMLRLLDSDHELLDVREAIWQESAPFLVSKA